MVFDGCLGRQRGAFGILGEASGAVGCGERECIDC